MFRNTLLSFIFFLHLSLIAAVPCAHGDNGEFWDAAVSSVTSTKKIDKSHIQLKMGYRYMAGVDNIEVSPATNSLLAELTFYGFKTNRYTRLFSLYASNQYGFHNSNSRLRLDAGKATLGVYNYLNGGAITIGVIESARQKAAEEQFSLNFKSFEYATGGAIKSFLFALTTGALGYEYRNYFSNADYHGLYIFNLGVATGFVLGNRAPVSFEFKLKGDVSFSWPRQKDVETLLELTWHINNRTIPLDISVHAGYDYYNEDTDNNNITRDFLFAGALLGARF